MTTRLAILLLLTLASVVAQDPPSKTKSSPTARSLRLLPLGEPPPFRQEVRDGIRYELEPDPASIPPRKVVLGDGATAISIRLNLGQVTEPLRIPVGTAPAVFRIPAEATDAKPKAWLTIQPPETGDVIALAWRDPGKPWSQARALVLPDSAAAFPAGNIRIVNLLPTEVAVVFGDVKVRIEPGKTLLRAIPPNQDMTIQIAYKDLTTGKFEPFYDGAMLLNRNERAQVFLHRADGEKPRQPAKAVIFNEPTPAAPPAKP